MNVLTYQTFFKKKDESVYDSVCWLVDIYEFEANQDHIDYLKKKMFKNFKGLSG